MPLPPQKIKVFRGLNTADDELDLLDNQATKASNVVSSDGVKTRDGFQRINSTAYAGAIVGLFDFLGVSASAIQSTKGYSRWLYSYVDASGYVYFVNSSSTYTLNIGRSLINQLIPTWEITAYEIQLRTPIVAGASYTGTATHWIDGVTNRMSTHRYNKAAMGTNAKTDRVTPDYAFSPVSLFTMTGADTLYIAYMTKVSADTHVHFFLDSMAADHTGYANLLDTDYNASTNIYSFLNVTPYDNTHIQFCLFHNANKLICGNVHNDGSNYNATAYTGAAYTPINQMAFAYVNPEMAGFYLTTADMIDHNLYFCTVDRVGTNLVLGTTLLDDTISFDIFDEQMNVAINGTTLYVAYCKNNGELRLGKCTTTGTGFSYEVIDGNNCHSANTYIVGTNLYIVYTSNDGSGYKVNVYTKAL